MAENSFATSNESIPSMQYKYTHTHSIFLHTAQGLAIMHKSKQIHTTFSLLKIVLQGSFTPSWTPDGHPLCQNVVYGNKSCSRKVVQTEIIWFFLLTMLIYQWYLTRDTWEFLVYILYAHRHFNVSTLLHTCGWTLPLLPPVQFSYAVLL